MHPRTCCRQNAAHPQVAVTAVDLPARGDRAPVRLARLVVRSRIALAVALPALALLSAATGAVMVTGAKGADRQRADPRARRRGHRRRHVAAQGQVVPWYHPLRFGIEHGTITSVSALGPDGLELPGTLTPAGVDRQRHPDPRPDLPDHARRSVDEDGKTSTVERDGHREPAGQGAARDRHPQRRGLRHRAAGHRALRPAGQGRGRPAGGPAPARGHHDAGRRGRLALVQLLRGPLPRARPTGSRAPRSSVSADARRLRRAGQRCLGQRQAGRPAASPSGARWSASSTSTRTP